jgi:hypothetical protein
MAIERTSAWFAAQRARVCDAAIRGVGLAIRS